MNLFNFIKTKVSIFDVVNEYTNLKKAGLYWKATCPFHHEKTASFTVSPHKEIFYCFGCHIGGDVISFVANIEHCSPLEAVKFLAERYHIELPKENALEHTDNTNQKRKHYFELCKAVALICHAILLKTPSALHYVTEREITPTSIKHFMLGYFPGGLQQINSFLHTIQQQNILSHDLVEAHILAKGKNVLYSPFEERIIFPIKDHLGRICGFGGRTFKPHDTRAKYYNTRENEFFSKGSLLFGLDLAKKHIQQAGYVFLVEGYTDCIAMTQYGFPHTIATLGTACTVEHLKNLARYANQVFVLYDGDKAGQQAIIRLTELCWHVNMELKVVCLPPGEDPASLLAQKYDLRSLITQAKDIFSFFIDSLSENFASKSLQEKLYVARKIISSLQKIDDHLKQNILLKRAADVLDIPYDSLKEELKKTKNTFHPKELPITPNSQPVSLPDTSLLTKPSRLEKKIFFAIMNNIQLFNKTNEECLVEYFASPLREVLQKLKIFKDKEPSLEFIHFFDKLNKQEQTLVSKLLLMYEENIEPHVFENLLTQFQKKNWKNIVNNVKIKIDQARVEGNEEIIKTLLQDFITLKKRVLGTNLIIK